MPFASTMSRDLLSAYAASAARVGSWALLTGVTVHLGGVEAFAVVALVRGTIGILNYATLGLAPAMIRMLPQASPSGDRADAATAARPIGSLYFNGLVLTSLCAVVGLLLVAGYAYLYPTFHRVPASAPLDAVRHLVIGMGVGMVLRLGSESAGAVLQVRGRIAADNLLGAAAEVLWVLITLGLVFAGLAGGLLQSIGLAYLLSGLLLCAGRLLLAGSGGPGEKRLSLLVMTKLLGYGGLITLAQLADYLYTPTDYILINRLIDPVAVAIYAPAVQIDGALHLLVLGIAGVLLPKASVAHAAGDLATVRRFYVRGTIAGLILTLPAALLIWLASPWIFRLWLNDEMTATQAILPLVLLHNLIGGSGTVGRSILLAMGKAGAYSVSVLAAGVANVAISYALVRYAYLGLNGIVIGTLCAVAGRALLWQPWYIRRTLRLAGDGTRSHVTPDLAEAVAQAEVRQGV